MAVLLGDVGGTNARFALARNGVIDTATVTRYRGDDYTTFDDVVRQFLADQDQPRITSASVAAAGPVSGGRARLTNRDWDMTEDGLARLTDADHVRIINDLTALGYATPTLRREGGLRELRQAPADRVTNGQSLVVGLGTGFNVCAVRALPNGGIIAMEAEEGHTQLPANIYKILVDLMGAEAAAQFTSTEETFAGRGLSHLHAARTRTPAVRSEEIAKAADAGEPEAVATYELFTDLVGLLCRELSMRFMPLEGLFLAGSVGRSIADRIDRFETSFLAEPYMRHIPENTPIFLISDDMAALHGCLEALS